jgi:MFS transporter, DHA2 family, multidrug resistance protein
MNSTLSYQTGIDQLMWSQIVRACGQPFVMIPLSTVATAGIEPRQVGSASALFNMGRNLGGSIGIAILGTLLSMREKLHSNRLGESISLANPLTRDRLDQLTQSFLAQSGDPVAAQNQAFSALDRLVRREANVMAYNDCFFFIGCALFMSAVLVLFFTRVKPTSAAVSH